MSAAERLYTPELLALAMRLADYRLTGEWSLTGEARSRSCGSTLAIGLALGRDGTIERLGMRVAACAVGQASAAIFADSAIGRSAADIAATLAAIEAWLADDARPAPDWPGFAALEPARAYPARHGAMLLPWKAALDALSNAEAAG